MALNLASSSSHSVQPQKHAVFLSFRGSDTRNTFVSHLYEALQRQGIPTFLDSEEFQRGREISEILNEIESSNVSIIIFSRNYADSPWCLDELVQIMKCKKTQRQEVVPVFYHVDPSDVESESGSYAVAIAEHENDPDNQAKVQIWRTALRQAASLSGWVLGNDRPEAPQIKEIVEGILKKLKHLYSCHELERLVGIRDKIQEVEALLEIERANIRRVVGIWGMGGVGKTTLAEVVFDRCSFRFDCCCFLRSVRERSKIVGADQLQRDLMREIFDGGNYTSWTMNQQLRHKRVLIVLDDVDKVRQFKDIVGNLNNLGTGSRIIVTGRDKNVLENVAGHGCIYEVPTLGDHEALELFNLHAVKEKLPASSHLLPAESFVKYAGGNPLAITVLGSFLYKKDIEEWKSALLKLETNPNSDILEVLRISYDGLDEHDKQIFLNIACFLKGRPGYEVESILDALGFYTKVGLRNLVDKSLVEMSYGEVDMHDLLEELGKHLVREECVEEPGKRSRLFDRKDVIHVLSNNKGTESVQVISSHDLRLLLDPTVFMNMTGLKFLELIGNNRFDFSSYHNKSSMIRLKFLKLIGYNELDLYVALKYLPNELRYLRWHEYPLKSLPSNFVPNNLVELDISSSYVERCWKGVQDMPNLKIMNLSRCFQMIKMPDLSKAPKLEKLDCSYCWNLKKVSPSISHLTNLKELDFQGCRTIRSFPSTVSMMSLKELPLRDCQSLITFPEVSRNIQRLILDGADIEEIPLETLRVLSSLKVLSLHNCKRLGFLPNSLGCLSSLQELDISRSCIESIPTNIIQLSQLQKLIIIGCKRLQCLPELPSSVCVLWADGCESLQNVSFSSRLSLCEVPEMLKADGCKSLQNVSFSPRLTIFEYPEMPEVGDSVLNFSFADCIKLDGSAVEKIFTFAQQSISTVVAPTKINKFVEEAKSYCKFPILSSLFVPGNEMPDWIEHQSAGSPITIDFQSLNLLGFIFCAVLDFHPVWRPRRSAEILEGRCSSFEMDLGVFESGDQAATLNPLVEILFEVKLNSNHCGSRRESKSKHSMLFPNENSQHVLLCYAAFVPNEADSKYSELSATMEVKSQMELAVVKWGLSLVYKNGDDEKEHINHKGKRITCEEN